MINKDTFRLNIIRKYNSLIVNVVYQKKQRIDYKKAV
jgi:hypothetical protein